MGSSAIVLNEADYISRKSYAALEFVSKDKNEALLFIFGPSRSFIMLYPNIRLFGLDKDKVYLVEGDITYRIAGDGLRKIGIPTDVHTIGTFKSKIFRIKAE